MRFYQLDIFSDECGDHGHKYFSNKADALKFKREWEAKSTEAVHWGNSDLDHPDYDGTKEYAKTYTALVTVINIEPNKAGLLNALNQHSFKPDG